MTQVLSGQEVAQALQRKIETKLKERKTTLKLATLRVGENPADKSYETGATKKLRSLGLEVENHVLAESVSQEALEAEILTLNKRTEVNGILLFQPLPRGLEIEPLRHIIAPEKDVDCTTFTCMGNLLAGTPTFVAGAPAAVMALLEHYEISLTGKKVVLIGRSPVVGKPLALLLIHGGATVTVCHSKTENLTETCRASDILITSAGVPNLVTREFVHENQIVVDVSTNVVEGKLCGDISPEIHHLVKAYTPTPGGIGAVTTSLLALKLLR